MGLKKVALILRKSPGAKQEESIQKQKDLCNECAKREIGGELKFFTFADAGVSGDDEQGRKRLHKFFEQIDTFDYAYCLDVDRFSRSYLGLYWFHRYFENSKCQLRFVNGPKLYNEDGNISIDGYLFFFILCGFASYELMSIRRRISIGRERAIKKGTKMGQQNIREKNPELCRKIIKDKKKMSYNQLVEKYKMNKSLIWKIINKYSKGL